MVRKDDSRISKLLSFILRHGPHEYGLQIDDVGFAELHDVLRAIKNRYPDLEMEELLAIVESDAKGRYEVVQDRIRARYGHSIPITMSTEPIKPPEILYHGTATRNLGLIMSEGLRAMGRQMVHLSQTIDEAMMVGRRHSTKVGLLRIRALDAFEAGVRFYLESSTYLTEAVPPAFIEVLPARDD